MGKRIWLGLFSIVLIVSGLRASAVTKAADLIQSDFAIDWIRDILHLENYTRPTDVDIEDVRSTERYLYRRIDMNFPQLGHVRLWVRQLKNMTGQVPVVFVLGGARSSAEVIKLFPERGEHIVVVFDYLIPDRRPRSKRDDQAQKSEKEIRNERAEELAQTASDFLRRLPTLQGRIAASLAYVANNPHVDPNRISVVAVSFGSFVAPLAMRLAEPFFPDQATIHSTVFAFGGGSVAPILLPALKDLIGADDYHRIEKQAKAVVDILEPKHHLPHLNGDFMIINGEKDDVIPKASAEILEKSLKGKKMVIEMPVGHINIDRMDIIEKTMSEVEVWLTENGAI